MGHLSLLTSNTARKVPRTYWYLLSNRCRNHRHKCNPVSVRRDHRLGGISIGIQVGQLFEPATPVTAPQVALPREHQRWQHLRSCRRSGWLSYWRGRGRVGRQRCHRSRRRALLAKGAQVRHELPDLLLVQALAPGWHRGARDAIFDPQKDLAIGMRAHHHMLGEVDRSRAEPNRGRAVAFASRPMTGHTVLLIELAARA